ncbi:MAG: hydroxyacid dehydrogenase [Anaerolineae bacterium]|nr:hydroxyacid dehydrogenase [Anaerolineae bacterium]
MALSVHYIHRPDPPYLADLQARLDSTVRLTFGPEVDPEAEVLVVGRPTRAQLAAAPDLRAVIFPFAGLPDTTPALLREFPHLGIHNLHHNAIPTAEMALTLLLAAAKCIVPVDRIFREHDWRPRYVRPNPSLLLAGKTALILGYGAIGQHVAQVCRALGMRVLATKRHAGPPQEYPDALFPPEQLPDLLPQAHALIVCLPLTDETKDLISAAEIALLPEQAIVVNVGRGAIIDEAALYDALVAGKLHAAGLDVWYNYPDDEASRAHTPPSAYPFHALDNVVMSPHRGGDGGAAEVEQLRMAHLAALLNAAARGEPIPNPVDLDAGY